MDTVLASKKATCGARVVSTRSGVTYSASRAPAGDVEAAAAAFQQAAATFQQAAQAAAVALQQTAQPTAPAPVKVTVTQGFGSAEEAAFDALKKINKVSIKENREYVANVYCYKQSEHSEEEDRFGYTGPIPGKTRTAYVDDPAILPPPGTKLVGDLHTHGPYQEYDPETGGPTVQALLSDGFSDNDIFNQILWVFGNPEESPEQRNEWFKDRLGVPPVDIDKMKFFVAGPSGDWLMHEPGRQATRAEDFPRTTTGEVIEDGGTVTRLGKLP